MVVSNSNTNYKKKTFKKLPPKGLTEYFYPNGSVFALNQKNADRKAKKLNLL